jgi:hypothetical protein
MTSRTAATAEAAAVGAMRRAYAARGRTVDSLRGIEDRRRSRRHGLRQRLRGRRRRVDLCRQGVAGIVDRGPAGNELAHPRVGAAGDPLDELANLHLLEAGEQIAGQVRRGARALGLHVHEELRQRRSRVVDRALKILDEPLATLERVIDLLLFGRVRDQLVIGRFRDLADRVLKLIGLAERRGFVVVAAKDEKLDRALALIVADHILERALHALADILDVLL